MHGLPTNASGAPSPVVLFDGVCNLCNGAVRFIVRRDPQARIRFAALQSNVAQTSFTAVDGDTVPRAPSAARATVNDVPLDSVILLEQGQIYRKSEAILRIARYLRWPWPLVAVCRVLPLGLRDALYDALSRRRYRWFGQRTSCMRPDAHLQARFLEWDEEK